MPYSKVKASEYKDLLSRAEVRHATITKSILVTPCMPDSFCHCPNPFCVVAAVKAEASTAILHIIQDVE